MKQGYFQICMETIEVVPGCPLDDEKYAIRSKKCYSVCKSNEATYQYHCLRTTEKTELVEMCAISKLLFGK